MLPSINNCIVSGTLTRDSEIRELPGGTMLLTFSIAVNKNYKDNAGEWQQRVAYVDCKMWNGERYAEKAVKGTSVLIVGEIEQERWEREGQKRSKIVLNVRSLKFEIKPKTEDQEQNYTTRSNDNVPF